MDKNKLSILLEKIKYVNDDELKSLIIELIEERNQLDEDVNIDSLTKVYNRRVLDNINSFSVLVMCDIDNFKNINDTYGHAKGDEVLKLVSNTFKKNIRNDDIICRYGGDEFLIVFTHCNLEVVLNRINKINNDILNSSNVLGKNSLHNITLSYGISTYKNNTSIYDSIEEADKNLYISKEKGLGQITFCNNITKIKKID